MPWIDSPKAILEAGLGGQAIGSAVVDVLSGKVNPSGKLAETFPVRLEDTPAYLNYPGEANQVYYGEGVFIGYRYYEKKKVKPLFPFGHGLSYTTFEYTQLQASKVEISLGEILDVTLTVRNSGTRAGKEVVQLYVRSLISQFMRPIKELKAFAKVALEPGEAKEVRLTLEAHDFAVYDSERQAWRLESGEFELLVGPSSEHILLSTGIVAKEKSDPSLPVFHNMSSIKQFLQYPAMCEALAEMFSKTPMANAFLSADEGLLSMPIGKMSALGIFTDEMVDTLVKLANGLCCKNS
jgi:beta-glucosidase